MTFDLSDDTTEAWEKDNLCGVCPYRQAVQKRNRELEAEVERLRLALVTIAEAGLSPKVTASLPRMLGMIARDVIAETPPSDRSDVRSNAAHGCDCGCWDYQQLKAEAERLREDNRQAAFLFGAFGHDGEHDRCDPCEFVRKAMADPPPSDITALRSDNE